MVAAVHEELTRPRVMAVVDDLGAQGASGVLEVKGDPSGAIYLDGGQIAFAGASWVPGLVARLRGVRTVARRASRDLLAAPGHRRRRRRGAGRQARLPDTPPGCTGSSGPSWSETPSWC